MIAEIDGSLVDVIGSGARRRRTASFRPPRSIIRKVWRVAGDFLYVADPENRRAAQGRPRRAAAVTTIAGLGHQAQSWPGIDAKAAAAGNEVLPDRFVGKPRETELNSPWDLLIHGNDLFIAMAGPHQIWKMPLDESEIGVYAGNGREDIVDGPLVPKEPYEAGFFLFRNPADWPPTSNGCTSPIAKGARLRAVPFDAHKRVRTVIGTADLPAGRLFAFGDHDGSGRAVRLQHPLGITIDDGTLYVADTYNNKIKAVNLAKKSVRTVVGTGKPGREDDPPAFDEPAGLAHSRRQAVCRGHKQPSHPHC